MISRCGLLTKRPDLTLEQFRDYWFNVHGPIGASMKNLRHYEQHLIVDRQQRHTIARGSVEIDGYSELWFDDIHDIEEGVASLNGAGAEDLAKFASDCKVLVFVKKFDTVVPEQLRGKKLLKRMSFFGRGEGITAERFQQEWWGRHSELVRAMPGYVGYAQNLVIDRIINGRHVSYDELPVEGMVEFWFTDMDNFDRCYASEEFARTAAHGQTFLGSVTTYMCETAHYPLPGEY